MNIVVLPTQVQTVSDLIMQLEWKRMHSSISSHISCTRGLVNLFQERYHIWHSAHDQSSYLVELAVLFNYSPRSSYFMKGPDWCIKWIYSRDHHAASFRTLRMSLISAILLPLRCNIFFYLPSWQEKVGVWQFQRSPLGLPFCIALTSEARDPMTREMSTVWVHRHNEPIVTQSLVSTSLCYLVTVSYHSNRGTMMQIWISM